MNRSKIMSLPDGGKRYLQAAFIPLCLVLGCSFAGQVQAEATANVAKLDDMIITATKTPHTLDDVPVDTVVVTAADIARSNAQNVMNILEEVPGITVANHADVFGTYTWNSAMRGLSFNNGYGLVLVDGQRVMGCGESGGMGEYGIGLNQIPVGLIERIEIVKGPGSALYGSDAMAGVVNIITKKAPGPGASKPMAWAGASYGWYDVKRKTAAGKEEEAGGDRNMSQATFGFGDRITDNIGYILSYGYESADDITAKPLQSDRHSLIGKVDARLSTTIDTFAKIELSDYEKTGDRNEESYRLALGGNWQASDAHLLGIKGYTYNWDFTHGTPGGINGFKVGDIGYNQVEAQYTWLMTKTNILTAGAELQNQGIEYTILNPNGSLVTVDESIDTASLYLQDELTLWQRLTLVGGARYDDHSLFGDEINPKISAMYKVFEATTLRGSVGRSFKSPTIRQLYYNGPYRHSTYYAMSNPDLEPEKAIGYSLSLEQRLLDHKVSTSIGYFRNDIDNMVATVDTGRMYDGLPLQTYENVQDAWTQGVEFMVNAKLLPGLELALSYTYTDSENEALGKKLTYLPEHSATLRPSYEYRPWGLGASVGLSFIGDQYTDTTNTTEIDAHTVVGAKIFKKLSENCKLSLEADDIFDSTESAVNTYYAGRTFIAKLDFTL